MYFPSVTALCVRCQHLPADCCLISVLGDVGVTLCLLSNTGYRPSGAVRKPHSLRVCAQEITQLCVFFPGTTKLKSVSFNLTTDKLSILFSNQVFKAFYSNLLLISDYPFKTCQTIIHRIIPKDNLVTCWFVSGSFLLKQTGYIDSLRTFLNAVYLQILKQWKIYVEMHCALIYFWLKENVSF